MAEYSTWSFGKERNTIPFELLRARALFYLVFVCVVACLASHMTHLHFVRHALRVTPVTGNHNSEDCPAAEQRPAHLTLLV